MSILDKPTSVRPAIPHDPLPQAGESLRREYDDTFDEKWLLPSLMIFIIVASVIWEWIRYVFNIQPTLKNAICWTVVGASYAIFFSYRMWRAKAYISSLKLGIRGEVHIAQYLEQTCRKHGYEIFHDIQCTGSGGTFNIDHVLIGPAGIFSIETKNWSLPPKGTHAKIHFDPESNTLIKPDGTYDENATKQAIANANYLQKLLSERTASQIQFPTRPVILLPGWWIENKKPSKNLWVLGNNTLHQWLPQQSAILSEYEVARLKSALEDYQRNRKP